MSQSNIHRYIESVCNQIRWKKVHPIISKELENHITDQKEAFIAQGFTEDMALDKAIVEMGSPIEVGKELDLTHRPKLELSIIVFTSIALLMGIVLRFAMGSGTSIGWSSIIHGIIGMAFMIGVYFLDYTFLGRYPKLILLSLIISILGVYASSSGTYVLSLGPLTIYGGYPYLAYLLLLFPTAYAGIIYSMRNRGYMGIILCGITAVILAFLVFNHTHTANVLIYLLTCFILLIISVLKGFFNVNRIKGLLLISIPSSIVAIVATVLSISNHPYYLSRIQNAIDPSLDPLGGGYMSNLTREIISNARFIGEGLGSSTGAILGEVEIHTDFLLTYVIHQFGWLFFLIIVGLLTAFIARIFVLCTKQKSILGNLVSTSIMITFTIQIIRYITYNLGIQLFSPLTLPFISYGGTSTVINMILMGILLSVFKWGDLIKNNLSESVSKKNILEYEDGKIIINLKYQK